MNLFTLDWRTRQAAFWLALVAASAALGADQLPTELPPPVPQEAPDSPPAPQAGADAAATTPEPATIMQHTVHQADPAMEGVFAPYSGKSPCGEFDDPYNDYFGDTRIWRSVVLGRLWVEGDYLGWVTKGTTVPALATTSPGLPALNQAGVIGQAGTTVLYGDETIHDTWRSGGRFNFGYWFTPEHIGGLETHMLWVDGRSIRYLASSDDVPIIAHPIEAGGQNDRILVSYPGVQDGSTFTRSDMGLFSLEALWRRMLVADCNCRIDFVGGYRFMRLFDRLRTDDAFLSLDAASGYAPDTLVERTDFFESKNDFHGGDFGLVCRWWNCCWALQLTGKVALGATHTQTTVDGETATELNGTRTVTTGGILAQQTNIGLFNQQQFAAVGEFGVRVEYACTPWLRLAGGYDLFWCSSVARVPDSIDLASGPFAFVDTNFWAHGVSLGLHYDY